MGDRQPPGDAESCAPRSQLVRGLARAGPVVLGYVPVGLAYGVLARQSGLSAFEAVAMSVLVFAGSAQFVAVAMLAAGAGGVAVVVATFFINLRHVLFGASLARSLADTPVAWRALLAHGVTDETYAVSAIAFARGEVSRHAMLATNVAAYTAWITASAVGAFAAQWVGVEGIRRLGAEFAIPAMFIALAAMMMKTRVHVATGAVAAVAGVAFRLAVGPDWYVMATVATAATAGVMVERWLGTS